MYAGCIRFTLAVILITVFRCDVSISNCGVFTYKQSLCDTEGSSRLYPVYAGSHASGCVGYRRKKSLRRTCRAYYYKRTWIVSGQQAYNTVYCCVVQLRIGALCQTRYCITNTSATFVRMLLRLALQMQALTRYPRRFLTRIVTISVRNGTCIAREASHLQGDAGGWGLIFLSKY